MDGITYVEIDAEGRGTFLDAPKSLPAPDPEGLTWIHVDLAQPDARAWLQRAGLDSVVLRALTAQETRPRCTVHGAGVLLNLRGVNLNPGDEVEDMVSIRLWANAHMVVSAQMRQLSAVKDLTEAIDRGQSPLNAAEFVARLALRLADRAEPVVAELNERIDDLEDDVAQNVSAASRKELSEIRRLSIILRRHMAPQRDALSTFEIEDVDWISHTDRPRIREATERMTRLSEELDAIRDRAQVVRDQIADLRAEMMNRQMLLLSVVAAIFLPLGLLTGLLGINVGGIPGADTSWAFWAVTVGLVVVGVLQVLLFRGLGLLRLS